MKDRRNTDPGITRIMNNWQFYNETRHLSDDAFKRAAFHARLKGRYFNEEQVVDLRRRRSEKRYLQCGVREP